MAEELRFNGPRLVAWLESTDAELTQATLGQRPKKAVTAWKEGADAPLGLVDVVCTRAGLHLSMVPDELWEEN